MTGADTCLPEGAVRRAPCADDAPMMRRWCANGAPIVWWDAPSIPNCVPDDRGHNWALGARSAQRHHAQRVSAQTFFCVIPYRASMCCTMCS